VFPRGKGFAPAAEVGGQPVRVGRPPGAAVVQVHRRRLGDERIDDAPLLFQRVGPAKAARVTLHRVFEETLVRPGKVEVIFLNLPLPTHPNAFQAAEAAMCAGYQKKFWEMHHLLFANQQALAPDQLKGYAEKLGLDVAAFQKCLSDGQPAGEIRREMRLADELGIAATPIYLLGRRVPGSDKIQVVETIRGVRPYEELEKKLNHLLEVK